MLVGGATVSGTKTVTAHIQLSTITIAGVPAFTPKVTFSTLLPATIVSKPAGAGGNATVVGIGGVKASSSVGGVPTSSPVAASGASGLKISGFGAVFLAVCAFML